MAKEIEIKNFVPLDYPEDSLVVVINPSSKDYLLFPDAIDILLEKLGYESFYFIQGNSRDVEEVYLISKNPLDGSFLNIRLKFYFISLEKNLYAPLFKIEECYLIDDFYRKDITKDIECLIKIYPKKVDLLSLLGLDLGERSHSFSSKHIFYSKNPLFDKDFNFYLYKRL
ncbi:MAG: hypothetical protein QXD62_04060 [Candidatus Woesearchaeota archaeon]